MYQDNPYKKKGKVNMSSDFAWLSVVAYECNATFHQYCKFGLLENQPIYHTIGQTVIRTQDGLYNISSYRLSLTPDPLPGVVQRQIAS